VAAAAAAVPGCRGAPTREAPRPAAAPTFNRDVAPILFRNCAVCHRPNESAPFSLLSYADARKRARQIARVTGSRYMPPWLPEPGYGVFAGERRLGEAEIRILREWAEGGAREGPPSLPPPPPAFPAGWPLGEPDLVLRVPRPYTLRAGGADVFRNFVVPVPVPATRYVSALDLRPGNKRIVHHANVLVDRTRSSRRRDAADLEVGFGGMELTLESDRFDPHSHFLFWKPGSVPQRETGGMTWSLEPGTDLVVNIHLQPSGKPERIQPEIGLYFSDRAPTEHPMLLQLEHDGALDIPAGAREFSIADDYRLPLDVDVLGVYPHAHYLGKRLHGFATLPDGTRRWLIRIDDWDFNWQAVYRYVEPVFLPKGSVVSMRFTYDNSEANPRNPSQPPRRVTYGNRSSDEMGHLWLQVLPRGEGDGRVALQESLMRHRLEKYPHEFAAHFNLGAVLQTTGRLEEALIQFREAVRLRPGDVTARNSLGTALEQLGRLDEAVAELREAVRLDPDYPSARYNLGVALGARGDLSGAERELRAVLRSDPADGGAHRHLGTLLARQGRLEAAAGHLEAAVRSRPDDAETRRILGYLYAEQGELDAAAEQLAAVARLRPGSADAENDLGSILARQGRTEAALACFRRALALDPRHAVARANLDRVRGAADRRDR
jgi:Flp pilus assembly protein TadD/mono/diheme cytochrome c family protein